MNRPICVTSSNPVGCTFLEWSIHYLAGHEQYFRVENQQWCPLVNDPINADSVFNAHKHQKNHPCGKDITKIFTHLLDMHQRAAPDKLFSFYPYPMHIDTAMRVLDIKTSDLEDTVVQQQICKHIKHDYIDLVNHCLDQDFSVIYVQSDPSVIGYFWDPRTLDRMLLSNHQPSTAQEKHNELQNAFFNSSQHQWQQMGLTDIWDQRERMALDIRPFDSSYIWDLGFDKTHQHINCQRLWDQTVEVVKAVMLNLSIKICSERFDQWLPMADQWQRAQLKSLDFYRDLPHIMSSIINGWHYEINDLELWQEAIIQHCLIYKHGLNLKTWQLSKFPCNTQSLHLLLENNTHPIIDIYARSTA